MIRDDIVQFLRRELIGPDPRPETAAFNGGEEILRPQDPPRLRFSAGVLFPKKAMNGAERPRTDEAEAETAGVAEGDAPEETESKLPPVEGEDPEVGDDQEVNRTNEFLPSAMGLTALVRGGAGLRVLVQAATYEKRAEENLGLQDKKTNAWKPHHWRKPLSLPPLELQANEIAAGMFKTLTIMGEGPAQKLQVHVFSRRSDHHSAQDDARMVTITLLNQNEAGSSVRDDQCFFQCELKVESLDGIPCFEPYPEREAAVTGTDPEGETEERHLSLLYRHRKTFAVGHGCAAAWDETGERASFVRAETLPAYEIKPILPREQDELPGVDLSFQSLAQGGERAVASCRQLAAAYAAWITDQDAVANELGFDPNHHQAASEHMEECRRCLERIEAGIELLANAGQPHVSRAFSWMNEAMLAQQERYEIAAKHRREWKMDGRYLVLEKSLAEVLEKQKAEAAERPPRGWRPFQLAFILMNLRSMVDRHHEERKLVDLIWFPTGGGKTEAYLGLTAFTIFHRRLEQPTNGGTTVLMRYTLRLLTAQQFERAASLICACELIRVANVTQLGKERISIGLWVGNSVTPGSQQEAKIKLQNLLRDRQSENPFLLLKCPWCGAEMGPVKADRRTVTKGYRQESGKVSFCCEDEDCEFSHGEGLPLHVIDEAIYEERPTLVVGTVDKFAMLPWKPHAGSLFGLNSGGCISPPDLVIQDELHLISGALGSMVGHYEATIDALCTAQDGPFARCSAKIVASTATICRASGQVKALYAREAFLFPPQGLQAGESFFARERTDKPGRLYVGVFGSALSSHVTAQIRVMSALLQAAKSVPATPADMDWYWTLMCYFNSIRELGHAATLLRADIRDYLNAMWDRLQVHKSKEDKDAPDPRRFINRDLELTSRIQNSEITSALQALFNSMKDGAAKTKAVDVCLATNMIQVGLDVSRLGLMTVVGQPKTTSEYIQATSRVGREAKGPGLVVMVFNCGKPRDRSHYEHFRSYHQSIYRWVEPTSVTPFALPVRDRALHAQLVTLARFWGDGNLLEKPYPAPDDDLVARIREVLLSRAEAVDREESAFLDERLMELVEHWRKVEPPQYGSPVGTTSAEVPLLYPSGSEKRLEWSNRAWPTPMSMRNVDATCEAEALKNLPD